LSAAFKPHGNHQDEHKPVSFLSELGLVIGLPVSDLHSRLLKSLYELAIVTLPQA
jgi:hypothetical protein